MRVFWQVKKIIIWERRSKLGFSVTSQLRKGKEKQLNMKSILLISYWETLIKNYVQFL